MTKNRTKRRHKPRTARKTSLWITNGTVTERDYLDRLKKKINHSQHRVTVRAENGDSKVLIRKILESDQTAFDQVWIIVDEDDFDLQPLLTECKRRSGRKPEWFAVISRPCFEVWLIAHYESVPNIVTPQQAKEYFANVSGKPKSQRTLPTDFPIDNFGTAAKNCQLNHDTLKPINSLPARPGSSMPHLIKGHGL